MCGCAARLGGAVLLRGRQWLPAERPGPRCGWQLACLSTRIENNAGKGAAGGKTRKRKNQKAEERQDEGIAMLLATIPMSEENSEAEMVLAAGDV